MAAASFCGSQSRRSRREAPKHQKSIALPADLPGPNSETSNAERCRTSMHRAAGLTLLTLFAAAPAAAQQRQYIAHLRSQVQRIEAILQDSGYRPSGSLVYGTLNSGDRETRPISLTIATRYIIAGVCDQDCGNVDLRLTAPDGARLARNIAADNRPTVSLTAPGTGQFSVTVTMAACRQSPCYWGFQVFEKR